jgi:predicted ABC-type ATPase
VNLEFHQWILDHIVSHKSLALETTLRSPITFDQARLAHDHGFWTSMHFLLAGSVEESIRRITERSYRGGHSASERLVRDIDENSTKNLFTALDFGASGFEVVRVYDNSMVGAEPRQVLSFRRGRSLSVADEIPAWLESLFKGTKFEIAGLRGR